MTDHDKAAIEPKISREKFVFLTQEENRGSEIVLTVQSNNFQQVKKFSFEQINTSNVDLIAFWKDRMIFDMILKERELHNIRKEA